MDAHCPPASVLLPLPYHVLQPPGLLRSITVAPWSGGGAVAAGLALGRTGGAGGAGVGSSPSASAGRPAAASAGWVLALLCLVLLSLGGALGVFVYRDRAHATAVAHAQLLAHTASLSAHFNAVSLRAFVAPLHAAADADAGADATAAWCASVLPVVVYVKDRPHYLRALLQSLATIPELVATPSSSAATPAAAARLPRGVVVISHDGLDPAMLSLVDTARTTLHLPILQVIHPHHHDSAGAGAGAGAHTDASAADAADAPAATAEPDLRGTQRLKRHWHWLLRHVFETVWPALCPLSPSSAAAHHHAPPQWTLFLEEDHVVAPDALAALRAVLQLHVVKSAAAAPQSPPSTATTTPPIAAAASATATATAPVSSDTSDASDALATWPFACGGVPCWGASLYSERLSALASRSSAAHYRDVVEPATLRDRNAFVTAERAYGFTSNAYAVSRHLATALAPGTGAAREFWACVDGWDVSLRRLQTLGLLAPAYASVRVPRVRNAGVEGINVNRLVYERMGLGLIRLHAPTPGEHRTDWHDPAPLPLQPAADHDDDDARVRSGADWHALAAAAKRRRLAYSGKC